MSDQPPRPNWPGQQLPMPEPPAQPSPGPAPEPEPVRPSWDSMEAVVRRTVDLRLIIAVLIGLVSVTGAVVAWRSSLAGEQATDKDRQAVAEATIVAQADANNEIIVQDARARFADHAAALVNAALLEEQADRLAAAGDDERARAAADAAVEERAAAQRSLEGGTAPVLLLNYVAADEATSVASFDEERLRDDLRLLASSQNQIDTAQTVRDANRLRAESQRLDGFLIPIVAAVVVLTMAQISRPRVLRLGLTGLGVAVWLVSAAVAFTGGS